MQFAREHLLSKGYRNPMLLLVPVLVLVPNKTLKILAPTWRMDKGG